MPFPHSNCFLGSLPMQKLALSRLLLDMFFECGPVQSQTERRVLHFANACALQSALP